MSKDFDPTAISGKPHSAYVEQEFGAKPERLFGAPWNDNSVKETEFRLYIQPPCELTDDFVDPLREDGEICLGGLEKLVSTDKYSMFRMRVSSFEELEHSHGSHLEQAHKNAKDAAEYILNELNQGSAIADKFTYRSA